MTFAIVAAAVLASSGLLVAIVLPEPFAREGPGPDPDTTELSVLLSLTLYRFVLEDRNLSNPTLQTVLLMLMDGDGPTPGSEAQVRDFVMESTTAILGEEVAFSFKVYDVQGEVAIEVLSPREPPSGLTPKVLSVDLRPQQLGAGTAPITVTLELWPRGST
jgi:hypothetical protein